jgi:hypothetical protein
MANEQNLIPLNQRRKEDAKRIQRMGADALNEQKRQRKRFREYLEDAVSFKVENSNGEEFTALEVIVKKVIQKAVNEIDLATIKFIVDMLGETPSQRMDFTSNGSTIGSPYRDMPRSEINKMIKRLVENAKKK